MLRSLGRIIYIFYGVFNFMAFLTIAEGDPRLFLTLWDGQIFFDKALVQTPADGGLVHFLFQADRGHARVCVVRANAIVFFRFCAAVRLLS